MKSSLILLFCVTSLVSKPVTFKLKKQGARDRLHAPAQALPSQGLFYKTLVEDYIKDEASMYERVRSAATAEAFAEKIREYDHLFLQYAEQDPAIIEPLIYAAQRRINDFERDNTLIDEPLISTAVMKALQKKGNLLTWLENHITNFSYLGFEGALLFHDEELQDKYQKTVDFSRPLLEGQGLLSLILRSNNVYMLKRLFDYGLKDDYTFEAQEAHHCAYSLLDMAYELQGSPYTETESIRYLRERGIRPLYYDDILSDEVE